MRGMKVKANVCVVTDVVREVERRILSHFMDLMILLALLDYDGEISGYDVLKYFQLKYRFLPSSGTVYSCLYHMERKGLLKGRQNGRKRVYKLTQCGTETAKALLDGRERIINLALMILQRKNLIPQKLLLSKPFSSMELRMGL